MKKIIGLLGFVVLILSLTVVAPSSSLADKASNLNTAVSQDDAEINATKYLNKHRVVFHNLELPPFNYYYNVAGWKGTLNRVSYIFYENLGITYGYYSGNVHCTTAPCGLN